MCPVMRPLYAVCAISCSSGCILAPLADDLGNNNEVSILVRAVIQHIKGRTIKPKVKRLPRPEGPQSIVYTDGEYLTRVAHQTCIS